MIRFFVIGLFLNVLLSDTILRGTVEDQDSNPIPYANIFIKDSFDGTSSDEKGQFLFTTSEIGNRIIVVSFIGYENYEVEVELNDDTITMQIILEESSALIKEVVITAGSFGASDDDKVIVLDPIDVVTVASSRGEISGALEALPGTQPQADKEGIYVRGGDASEAKQIVDGMLIQNPYFSDVPDIPQRGRFEPFDFQGTAFSQGGYSAQYGQALSAIVDLKTWSRFGDFNANTYGITPLSLSYGRAYGNDSTVCGINLDYTNIEYFQNFNNEGFLSEYIKDRTNFEKAPEGFEVKANYSKKFENGIYKFLGKYSSYSLGTSSSDSDIGTDFNLDNDNIFFLTTYIGEINKDMIMQLGLSYSDNENDSKLIIDGIDSFGYYFEDNIPIDSKDDLLQFRAVLSQKILGKSKIKFGMHFFDQSSGFNNYIFDEVSLNFIEDGFYPSSEYGGEVTIDEYLSTAFSEIDLRLFKRFAVNAGVRYEHSKLLDKANISPRFSSAYKLGKNSQISYAYGKYYQTPDMGFDLWYRQNNIITDFNNSELDFENSVHHIFNYEWSKKGKILRFEIFDKKYDDLILLNDYSCFSQNQLGSGIIVPTQEYCLYDLNNQGYGYSRGAELFWRNDQSSDGVGRDIWVAYSYLDSKRKFKQYNEEIIPNFASKHKLTFIYKNGIKLKNGAGFNSSLAVTATSGYPYYDPWNNIQHESDPYLSFDIGGSYLPDIENGFMVIFFNLSNPFGYRNSFGYNYVDYDNISMLDPPEEKLPSSLRSIFIGCFMFFSIDK